MYTVVIDESGDVGLNNVKTDPSYGPSQYFTLCATIFREDNRSKIEVALKNLPFKKRDVHSNKLSHFEKVHLCKTVSQLPLGMVGVVSNKLSLLSYIKEAQKTPTHYYNKVMQYLLERIGALIAAFGIAKSDVRIVLEARSQQYSSLLLFIERIQHNPLDSRARLIQNVDRFAITTVKKAEEKCMLLSDIGAHALFCAVRRDEASFGLSEPRYLEELSTVFLSNKHGEVVPAGIKLIHSADDLGVPVNTVKFFSSLRNSNADYQQIKA